MIRFTWRADRSGYPSLVIDERLCEIELNQLISQRLGEGEMDDAVQVNMTKLPAVFDVELCSVHSGCITPLPMCGRDHPRPRLNLSDYFVGKSL